jgi:murein DD-endopeptidase MepM/ murein hydrolase activator NlpD
VKSYSQTTLSGFLVRPVQGGRRTQGLHGNNAVDIAATPGTAIVASGNGTVLAARVGGYNGGYGNMVIISHANGVQTLYAHMREVYVRQGETVIQGQVIGGIGNTGRSTGPHLHFEVRGAKNPF